MPKAALYVVPVDFSPESETTVTAALALAKERGAQVHLLEIIPKRGPSRFRDTADLLPTSAKHHWSRLEESVQAARSRGVAVRAVEYSGDAAEIIASHVQLAKAKLIILGQHYGSSRWRRNTRIVAEFSRSAPVPVLVLPPRVASAKSKASCFRNIVSAVDLTVASAVALRTVLDMIRRTGARLTLVHALDKAAQPMAAMGSEAFAVRRHVKSQTALVADRLRLKIPADVQIRVDARVTTGDPHHAILSIAAEVHADLIVMGVAPRARLDEVLFGSTLRRVLRQTKIPLLVLPVPAGAHRWLQESEGVEVSLTDTRARTKRLHSNGRP